MHITTKRIKNKDYLYLGWRESGRQKWRYLGKNQKSAIKKLLSLNLPDKEREKLIESLDSDVWETPDYVIESVRLAMGSIDLDPATKPSNPTGAERFYTKDDDGLRQRWEGRVYLNPPYSKPAPFLLKLIDHYQSGDVPEAISLCKSGVLQNKSTGRAIHESKAAVCRWEGRLNFKHTGHKDKGRGSDFDVVAIYWGPDVNPFHEVFQHYGFIE
jgi:phage N-6-adenine-methyltransferase